MESEPITARTILNALASKHHEDLYTEEVSLGQMLWRIDAWAAPRSLSKWETAGYEVKVSRADWMRDNKLEEYAPYVHRLWVVCPWGLIQPEEVSACCGLMWVTKTGSRAVRKKKAPLNDAPYADEVLRGVVARRAKLRATNLGRLDDRAEQLRAMLEEKRERQRIGWVVGGRVRELESENVTLRCAHEAHERLAKECAEAGFRSVGDAIRVAKSASTTGRLNTRSLRWQIQTAQRQLDDAMSDLDAALADGAREGEDAPQEARTKT